MGEQAGGRYSFGDVVLDTADFRVWREGEVRRVTPRAFEVLHYLVRNRGRLVSKQELFDDIWGSRFVTDNALTRMVKEIRQAIGDDADGPRYIETVPKRGYRFIGKVNTEVSAGDTVGSATETIAIPPFFADGSEDVKYFAEAVWESIGNHLAASPDLRICPRSLVLSRAAAQNDPIEVGRLLNARKIVCGRVRQRADVLTVDAELIDVDSQSHLWGDKYVHPVTNFFELQAEVSATIAEELKLKVAPQPQSVPTRSSHAYASYLKGRYFWNRRPLGIERGIEYFEQALEHDPDFAHAHAGLADLYSTMGSWENGSLPPAIAMPRACAADQKALMIDGRLAEAHTTLAYVKLHFDWDFAGAEAGFLTALPLDPRYAHAHHWLSHYYMAIGETEKSLESSLKALESDPLDLIINVHLAWHYWMAREPDEAIAQAEKTRELNPLALWPSFFTGVALEGMGLYRDAVAELRRAVDLSPDYMHARGSLAHALGRSGDTEAAERISTELEKARADRFVPAYDIAIARLGSGMEHSVLPWLRQAILERSSWVTYFGVEPRLEDLRHLPDFFHLVQNMRGGRGTPEQ